MPENTYDDPSIDFGWQYIGERPELDEDDSETVYATEPEPPGDATVDNVPVSDGGQRPDDRTGQTTIGDWGGGGE